MVSLVLYVRKQNNADSQAGKGSMCELRLTTELCRAVKLKNNMENPKHVACPCGGQPEQIEENTDMNLSLKGVRCKKCGEAIPLLHDHAPEAIRAWNDWAGGRKPAMSKTAGVKAVGSGDWLDSGLFAKMYELTPEQRLDADLESNSWKWPETLASEKPAGFDAMDDREKFKHPKFRALRDILAHVNSPWSISMHHWRKNLAGKMPNHTDKEHAEWWKCKLSNESSQATASGGEASKPK